MTPTLVWLRRDLRLTDHAALTAAAGRGGPVICVALRDTALQSLGAAPKWRFGLGLEKFAQTLEAMGSKLIFRTGEGVDVLPKLASELGAGAVYWSRSYDPSVQKGDAALKSKLKDMGLDAQSFTGHLLFEPWSIETKTGGYYRVYSPMWRAVRGLPLAQPLPKITKLAAPDTWPASENIADWQLGADMVRGADVVCAYAQVGEDAAQARLDGFVQTGIHAYKDTRDIPSIDGTSGLSENLAYGEISPLTCWFAALAPFEAGAKGAETFLKELVWREFAYHLLHHTPHITHANWKPAWDNFPWEDNPSSAKVIAWKQGRTGLRFVDASMRQMYVTGTMHNRGRMIVASYLTKHLMTHWKIGLDWFEDCLIDWDPASNAMGWQWTAGSGPDAAPYFRIYNPESQIDKFDPDRTYIRTWIAEGQANPSLQGASYFKAIPKSWGLSADMAYPDPIVSAADGRKAALEAFERRDF
ncbi:MAG: cryptochrome/photolyase family protein [Planktomarina sp.]